MTPLETIRRQVARLNLNSDYIASEIEDALVAAGHLPAPDVTIQVTLTPEEADLYTLWWSHLKNPPYGVNSAACKVRDAILEARGAQ